MQLVAEQKLRVVVRSDVALLAGVRRHEQAALAMLYDRYAPLVFTLARSACPDTAETITEEVFYRFWSSRGALTRRGLLIHTFIDLTEQAIREDSAAPRPNCRAKSSLAVLVPFEELPPVVFEILVLTYIGQIDVHEIAGALDLGMAQVREAFVSGIRTLHASGQTAL